MEDNQKIKRVQLKINKYSSHSTLLFTYFYLERGLEVPLIILPWKKKKKKKIWTENYCHQISQFFFSFSFLGYGNFHAHLSFWVNSFLLSQWDLYSQYSYLYIFFVLSRNFLGEDINSCFFFRQDRWIIIILKFKLNFMNGGARNGCLLP